MTQGQRLRALRERMGMTQEQVAEHIDRTRTTVVNMEADKQALSLALAVAFAKLYGVTLDALAGVGTGLDAALGDYAEGYKRGHLVGQRELRARVQRALDNAS